MSKRTCCNYKCVLLKCNFNPLGCPKLTYYPRFELIKSSSEKTLTSKKSVLKERSNYLFGYNQQEKTDEISGNGNHNTAQFWEYDTRIARRWNLDPIFKEYESPYAAFGNNPIWLIDLNGADTNTFIPDSAPKNASVGDTYTDITGKSYTYIKDENDLDGFSWSQVLDDIIVISDISDNKLTRFQQELRDLNWYGWPNNPTPFFIDSYKRSYDLGYMPFRPQAMGLSINFNLIGLGTGYAGSINVGHVGNDFGMWYTGGPAYGTWNASLGFGGFMSEWHGAGKATFDSYMGKGDGYNASIMIVSKVPVYFDAGYSRGFNDINKPIWKTVSGGMSIGNPKLPGRIGLTYQPETNTIPIFKTSK